QLAEHSYGACLATLEVAGTESAAGGEFVGGAQDCFRRITTSFPVQLISRRRGETVLREEPHRAQAGVLFYRAQHVRAGHVIPSHHAFTPSRVTSASGAGLLSGRCR